jgi:hypothetical protein
MFNLNTDGSKLTYLTSGTRPGKIKFLDVDASDVNKDGDKIAKSAAQIAALGKGGGVTGIVFPIGISTDANKLLDGTVGPDTAAGWTEPNTYNVIGDPGERNYQLTSGDLFWSNGTEKHGGAQKLVLAVLDSAYVAYNSGVAQGKGLSSMTVTRGDMTLNSSAVTGISGIVNTYSRNYSVNFQFKQSGMIENPNTSTTAFPEVANDLNQVGNLGDGPF